MYIVNVNNKIVFIKYIYFYLYYCQLLNNKRQYTYYNIHNIYFHKLTIFSNFLKTETVEKEAEDFVNEDTP